MFNPVQWIRRRRIAAVLVVIAAIVLLRIVLGGWGHATPSPYLTATATRADMLETVLATGTIHPVEQVAIGAQVSGQIKSIRVKLGDHVKRGELLAEIDPVLQQNALLSARAALDSVRAQRESKVALLTQYRHEEERQAYMLAHDASSRANYEVAQGNVETTRADIESLDAQITEAKIQVDNARAQLSYTRITAPIGGDVISMVARAGQTVVSAQAVPILMILANVETMTVRTKISEADVVRVKPGLPVRFTILGEPDKEYVSEMRAVEPAPESIVSEATPQQYQPSQSATPAAVYYNGLFDVPNPRHTLRTSMTAQVSIVLGGAHDALVIPRAALSRRVADNRYEVSVLGPGGEPRRHEIAIGLLNDANAQVLSGLSAGDRVVVGDSPAHAQQAEQGN